MTLPKYMQRILEVKLDDPRAKPLRAHPSDAGADLFSMEEVSIYPGDQKMIDTGVAIKIPLGYVGLIFNRSSQGKVGVQITNGTGVIDSDYRGNLKVLLKNNGEDPYFISPLATRIAQLVIMPVVLAGFCEYPGTTEESWHDTARGTGGFGSTG